MFLCLIKHIESTFASCSRTILRLLDREKKNVVRLCFFQAYIAEKKFLVYSRFPLNLTPLVPNYLPQNLIVFPTAISGHKSQVLTLANPCMTNGKVIRDKIDYFHIKRVCQKKKDLIIRTWKRQSTNKW